MAMKCAFALPDQAAAADAACCLHCMASGDEPWDAAEAAKCFWILQGFSLTQTANCPDPGTEGKRRIAEATRPAHAASKDPTHSINWGQLIQTILAILAQLFPPKPPTP